MRRIVSCLPYDVTVRTNREPVTLRGAATPALVSITRNQSRWWNLFTGKNITGFCVKAYDLTHSPQPRCYIENLPDPKEGVWYLVTGDVALAAVREGRNDICVLQEPQARERGSIGCKKLFFC